MGADLRWATASVIRTYFMLEPSDSVSNYVNVWRL